MCYKSRCVNGCIRGGVTRGYVVWAMWYVISVSTNGVPFKSGILKQTRFSERGTRFFSNFKMLFTVGKESNRQGEDGS